ncbi:MAG: ParA family protein [Planctomycetes bacterium]|nr:ParA family protein [Planctomycetota bacterium]
MKTIAFFNNKGGVGKTTLVYHLSHMLSRLGHPTLAVDLDPQANLTSAFFDEEFLERIWEDDGETIVGCVDPILEGTGDITPPRTWEMDLDLSLIPGSLGLSRFEDKLSASWRGGLIVDPADLRVTTAFHRIILCGAKEVGASVVLLDVGPNLGAINRAALLAADYLVIPMAADLYSLQGLRNLGPTVRRWRAEWGKVREATARVDLKFELPVGEMEPAGYVVLQHAVRLDRPVRAFGRWLERIPSEYERAVLNVKRKRRVPATRRSVRQGEGEPRDAHCLATLRNFRSLMPMAQDARKPMFDLRAADGAIGSHAQLVQTCRGEFESLALRIAERCGLAKAE